VKLESCFLVFGIRFEITEISTVKIVKNTTKCTKNRQRAKFIFQSLNSSDPDKNILVAEIKFL
jgi:hypothetical protein